MENPIVHDYSNPQQGTSMMASPEQMQQNDTNNERKAYSKFPPTRRDDRKIFVGGLPSNVTDEEFLAFFSQFGTVLDSVVMFDRETHRSRGFGFVTFEDPNVVRLLLEMRVEGTDGIGRVQMRGKVCEIKAAQPKEPTYSGGGRGRRVGNNKGYRPYPQQQQQQQQGYPPSPGQAFASHGYPPSSEVNQGVPSTLPMATGHAPMYPHYQMGGYYGPPQGMSAAAAAYSPYMAYPPDAAVAYYEQGNNLAPEHPAYATPNDAMGAGPHAQQQTTDQTYGYGNAFVPLGNTNESSAEPKPDETPQGTSNGEEAKQN